MDRTRESQAAGYYFAAVVNNAVLDAVHTARFGLGRRKENPFTRQPYRRAAPTAMAVLHDALAQRGLHQDPGFLRPFAAAIREACSIATVELLADLAARDEFGDGGADFDLRMRGGVEPDLPALRAAFEKSGTHQAYQVELVEKRAGCGWPTNVRGLSACACCGYYTISDGPCTYEQCAVCGWTDEVDLDDIWNMSKWGRTEEPFADVNAHYGIEPEEPWVRVTVQEVRSHLHELDEMDYTDPEIAQSFRKPLPEEIPRYDWAKDSRPY